MKQRFTRAYRCIAVVAAVCAMAADWTQFRGPGGFGKTAEKGLPVTWSAKENIVWRTELPGPGTSCPIALGDRVYLTCYSGYGLEPGKGEMNELRRHLVCVKRSNGQILWTKQFEPQLPEHAYQGEGSYHGYSSSTPTTDGERLYVFFGKSGVFCFDLDGDELWHASVGTGISGWGSGNSPLLYKNTVIINASVESGSLVALDKLSGKEVWRAGSVRPGTRPCWLRCREARRSWSSAFPTGCAASSQIRERNSGVPREFTATSAPA